MATKASGSITVNFQTSVISDGHSIDVELDDEKNEDKTTFGFGQTAHFRLYPSPFDMKLANITTDGTLTIGAAVTKAFEENVAFSKWQKEEGGSGNEVTVSRPIKEGTAPVLTWYTATNGIDEAAVESDGKTIRLNAYGIGFAKVSYQSEYKETQLTGVDAPPENFPDDESYPVAVVVYETE